MTDIVRNAVESVIDFQRPVNFEELPRPFMAPKVIAFRQRLGEYEH